MYIETRPNLVDLLVLGIKAHTEQTLASLNPGPDRQNDTLDPAIWQSYEAKCRGLVQTLEQRAEDLHRAIMTLHLSLGEYPQYDQDRKTGP